MLKKLLKYDLQFMYKGLIIFYGLFLFFAILTRIFLSVENSFIINIILEFSFPNGGCIWNTLMQKTNLKAKQEMERKHF